MAELTAKQVWEMVKDVPGIVSLLEKMRVDVLLNLDRKGMYTWIVQDTDVSIDIEPHMALALIVDAAKREMGTAWYGCQWSPFQKTWKAYTKTQHDWPGYEGDTEASAVLAAFKAWKEQA